MGQIVETLKELIGKDVHIYIEHKLFGKQHLQMKFEPETEIGLGFRCRDQIIYIDYNDVVDYSIENCHICINGNMMCIKIVCS